MNIDKNKFCKFYVDYARECVFEMDSVSLELDTTVRFCVSGDYKDCPFYKFIENPSAACENFKHCDLCKHFKRKGVEQFVDLCNTWCLNDFTSCARYKIKQSGGVPESTLHPDGHLLEC